MDEIEDQSNDYIAHRRRLREAKRQAARRRGHRRLAVAVCLLAGVVTACCWGALSLRARLGGSTTQATEAKIAPATTAQSQAGDSDRSTDQSQEPPSDSTLAALAAVKPALSKPTMNITRRLPPAPINTKFPGITMFRGNATRTYYGEGPVPKKPTILWTFPKDDIMTSPSSVAGETKGWSGTGWTGQPVVAERGGRTEVIFGAYDRKIHFLDAKTGERVRPDFATGDIIKGTVTLDPDGYPILYSGSRDNYYRVIALDREEPTELWKLSADAVENPVWNNDWDGNGLIVNGFLFEGGENSHFFIVKLNRGWDDRRKVTADPEVVFSIPGFTQELFDAIGDKEVSIENSPAIYKNRVYFTNSGGLVWGLDIRGLSRGREPKVVFRWWAGDDTDPSIVIDEQGMLYVASELQRHLPRAKQNGQIMKLNPYKPKDPLVWGVKVPPEGNTDGMGGCWATPALHGDMLYEPTHPGGLLGIDTKTGRVVWRKSFSWHAWGSASVIDDVLMVPDTNGTIHAYDIRNPKKNPPELWQVSVPSGAAIESTPVCWKGRIYVGCRDGKFYCFGDE